MLLSLALPDGLLAGLYPAKFGSIPRWGSDVGLRRSAGERASSGSSLRPSHLEYQLQQVPCELGPPWEACDVSPCEVVGCFHGGQI